MSPQYIRVLFQIQRNRWLFKKMFLFVIIVCAYEYVYEMYDLSIHTYICVDRSDVVSGHLLKLVLSSVCGFRDRVRWSCLHSKYFRPLSLLVGQIKME